MYVYILNQVSCVCTYMFRFIEVENTKKKKVREEEKKNERRENKMTPPTLPQRLCMCSRFVLSERGWRHLQLKKKRERRAREREREKKK